MIMMLYNFFLSHATLGCYADIWECYNTKACPGFFIGAKTEWPKIEAEIPKAESGVRFMRGQQAPSPPVRGLGSAVSSPSGVRDGAPTAQRFSTIFRTKNGLS